LLNVDRSLAARPQHGAFAVVRDIGLVAMMFALTLFGWLLFRAPDLATVGGFVSGLAGNGGWGAAPWAALAGFVAPLLLVQAWQLRRGELEFIPPLPGFVRLNVVLFLIFSLIFLAPAAPSAFIYFDF